MPYAMHSEYLYKLRRKNDLAEGRIFATKKVKKAHAMTSATKDAAFFGLPGQGPCGANGPKIVLGSLESYRETDFFAASFAATKARTGASLATCSGFKNPRSLARCQTI